MAKTTEPRIAILGAGPIGLEAALYARRAKLPVTLFERGPQFAMHLRRWGHVKLFSPFGMNATKLGRAAGQAALPGDNDLITGREHLDAYLQPMARSLEDCIRFETEVAHIGKAGFLKDDAPGDPKRGQVPFRLLVRHKGKEEIVEADVVLDCSGTYGQHRWLGDGGIPALGETACAGSIAYGLEDVLGDKKNHYAGKNILVIGSGYSAATSVCNLATLAEQHPETWTIWLTRSAGTQPIKRIANDALKERDRLAVRANTLATRGEGNVEFHNQTRVQAIESFGQDKGFRVHTLSAGKERTFEVERIIANVGYTPDNSIYRELQVHECYASLGPMALAAMLLKAGSADCLALPAAGAQTLKNPEPGFFILGAKSFGRSSNFLLRSGFEQIREAFTLITGNDKLDLYK